MQESIVRKGAVAAFALQGKRHGDDAVRHYNKAKDILKRGLHHGGENYKSTSLDDALQSLIDGLISTRSQIGSVSAQITAASVV